MDEQRYLYLPAMDNQLRKEAHESYTSYYKGNASKFFLPALPHRTLPNLPLDVRSYICLFAQQPLLLHDMELASFLHFYGDLYLSLQVLYHCVLQLFDLYEIMNTL